MCKKRCVYECVGSVFEERTYVRRTDERVSPKQETRMSVSHSTVVGEVAADGWLGGGSATKPYIGHVKCEARHSILVTSFQVLEPRPAAPLQGIRGEIQPPLNDHQHKFTEGHSGKTQTKLCSPYVMYFGHFLLQSKSFVEFFPGWREGSWLSY